MPKTTPTVDPLLPGYKFSFDSGGAAFCAIVLVESEGRRIVVDTGHAGRRGHLQAALRKRGLTPEDIDLVFMTHVHWDHVQNFDMFGEAEMLVHPAERAYVKNPHPNDFGTPRWTSAAIETATIQEVSEGDELAAGVRVIELPGHSAGTMGLMVETEAGIAAVVGDAVGTAENAKLGQADVVFWSPTEADDSISKVVAASDLIYPGHDRPFRLDGDEIDYLEPYSLGAFGIDPEAAGVTFRPLERTVFIMQGANP
jgi:N-acyl homoserine lactone hydrolase